MNLLLKFTRQREFMIFMIIVAIFISMTIASEYFLTQANLLAVLMSLSIEVLIAVAMTNLMVAGGFDMSVGSVLAFTGAFTANLVVAGVPTPLAVLCGIAIGAGAGLFNGFVVAKLGINPFVTTLASLSLFRGLTMIISGGKNISGLPDDFKAIGQTQFFDVLQTPIIIAVVFILLGDFLLRRSRFFRQSYYIGGNERAARLSGIPVDRIKILAYVLTGVFAGIAGVVMTSRLGAASMTAGNGMELRVITAVIIGGASLQGGEGTVIGAFLGSLMMALIINALTLLNVDVYWQTFVIGATLLIAVLIDRAGKVRKEQNALRAQKMTKVQAVAQKI